MILPLSSRNEQGSGRVRRKGRKRVKEGRGEREEGRESERGSIGGREGTFEPPSPLEHENRGGASVSK